MVACRWPSAAFKTGISARPHAALQSRLTHLGGPTEGRRCLLVARLCRLRRCNKSAAIWGTPVVMPASSRRQPLPSRPGEFHPESLTEPDLILSHHPARAIARRLPPSAEPSGSSRFDPVGPSPTAMTRPLCSTGITLLRRYYG